MSQVNRKLNAFGIESTTARNSAFTLIELLVVISIIVILVGIIAPTIGKALQLAKKSSAAAYLNSVANAAELYQEANGLYPGQGVSSNLTGSQMLAVCLLDGLVIDGSGNPDASAGVKANYLDEYKTDEETEEEEGLYNFFVNMYKYIYIYI